MRLAHMSDVHFGRLSGPTVVPALHRAVGDMAVDLVVVSGDLTQRARASQYTAARAFLDDFVAPVLVIPGNHDVPAWYRPAIRMFSPLSRYERFIDTELYPTFESGSLWAMGFNSAHGWTIKGGTCPKERLADVKAFYSRAPAGAARVFAVHHHLIPSSIPASQDIAREADGLIAALAESGVELILCGHLHVSHVERVHHAPSNHSFVIASAGTATSSRGRGSNAGLNFFNIIDVNDQSISIKELKFDRTSEQFREERETSFPRIRDL